MTIKPVIKWSGSKRSQANAIIQYFPDTIDTYYEPFVGGGSVIACLLNSNKKAKYYVCSDINKDLITLWKAIKSNPSQLAQDYEQMWNELNIHIDLDLKKEQFYKVRARFNKDRNPADFLFLSRTVINGLIRFNRKNQFNSPLHLTRNGIIPSTLKAILIQWSELLKPVDFICCSYGDIKTSESDYLYLDPPYAGTTGIYNGKIDYEAFWTWLREQSASFTLSFDGKCGKEDRTYAVPKDVYKKHVYLESGCSSFKRLRSREEQYVQYVQESLYIR